MFQQNGEHQRWLEAAIDALGGVAGTVHVQRGTDLFLTAAHRIPPPVIAVVSHVPQGKGMAGLAQTRKQPVQTCNLQDDQSGNVRPGAKAVDAQAAIAVPLLDDQGAVLAVVGVAWNEAGEIDAARQQVICARVGSLKDFLDNGRAGARLPV